VVITRNLGMTVAQSTALRIKVREAGASFKVAKNSLAKIAAKGTAYEGMIDLFTGPTGTGKTSAALALAADLGCGSDEFGGLQVISSGEQTADAAFTDVCHVLLEQAITNGIDAVAAARNLSVAATPLFGADDFIPQVENAAELREKAFELDARQAQTRFNAVRGTSVVYLIAAHSNDVARIPDFAEVADRVRADASADARIEAYKARITAACEAITAAVAAGKTFEDAARAVNLTPTTNYSFSINAGLPAAIPEINAVIREAVKLRAGGIAASPAPRFGNAVIVAVATRTPGDPMTSTLLRDQIRSAIEKRIFPPLFAEWSAWNLKQSDFIPAPGTEPVAASKDDAETAE
jgi:DNA polymerase III delta prime subunit